MAEREQGITIDVAYRYFTTDHRSFIVADTPGHEEYTRNMAVGASFAQLAIVMVDAKQGVLVQTRRHSRICSLMGIRHFVFAVNKMDLVGYSEERFKEIEKDIRELAKSLDLYDVVIIPVSATEGDNVTKRSENMPWYTGPVLLSHLENVDVSETEEDSVFYMPVQRVCRPNHEFRGFQGQIESGHVHTGQTITTLPSNETATVKAILVGDKEAGEAGAGRAVTIQQEVPTDYKEISFVCLRPDGSLELPSTLSIVCRSVSKKLEGFEDFHFHQLRHTYTSNLLSNGAAPKDVQELLGHSDVSTTMNIYAHSTRKAKRDSARLLDKVASNA